MHSKRDALAASHFRIYRDCKHTALFRIVFARWTERSITIVHCTMHVWMNVLYWKWACCKAVRMNQVGTLWLLPPHVSQRGSRPSHVVFGDWLHQLTFWLEPLSSFLLSFALSPSVRCCLRTSRVRGGMQINGLTFCELKLGPSSNEAQKNNNNVWWIGSSLKFDVR